ncbi:nitrogen permease regulator-like protein [Cryptosporidium canis]|uniref:Nitrogen permease regulator-like protein n=1 Tax=Cryptosporidium canis TaxID=195482 RepID=A0ABQ8P7B6_9CRYT|nr:nitrogen permease regulator-like protein [Cryptosporidium canis]KAJ1614063.1 nitrogen permease regulator-like protein [Cryptosporidium canis]
MVSFVCGNCQDVLKKNKVDSHCVGRCRNAWEFTCIDCNSTFEGFDYRNHNSCITEEEKYCGKFKRVKKPTQSLGADNSRRKEELKLLIEKILRKNGSMNWKRLLSESIKEYMNSKMAVGGSENENLKWELLASIPICYTTKDSNMVIYK